MPRPNKLHDDLDALLDGRPVELTEDLAPLLEAADVLRAELAAYELDPQVADRHLERVLEGSGTVVRMPLRQQPNGWDLRRRVAAVVLAAALVLAPATMASAAALPGQAMYPFKLAIEQLRLASVQWSSTREAGERTRVASERLDELERLVELRMFNQVPTAIHALERAVVAARAAVDQAQRDGEPVPGAAAKLVELNGESDRVVEMVTSTLDKESIALPKGTRNAIQAAVDDSRDVLATPTLAATATTTPPATTPPPASTGPPDPSPTTAPPASVPQTTSPTTTVPPASAPTSTVPPTTQPPPSTEGSGETPGSVDKEPAADGRSQDEVPGSTNAGP